MSYRQGPERKKARVHFLPGEPETDSDTRHFPRPGAPYEQNQDMGMVGQEPEYLPRVLRVHAASTLQRGHFREVHPPCGWVVLDADLERYLFVSYGGFGQPIQSHSLESTRRIT